MFSTRNYNILLSMLLSLMNSLFFFCVEEKGCDLSNTSIMIYQTTRCYNAETQNINIHCGQTAFADMII